MQSIIEIKCSVLVHRVDGRIECNSNGDAFLHCKVYNWSVEQIQEDDRYKYIQSNVATISGLNIWQSAKYDTQSDRQKNQCQYKKDCSPNFRETGKCGRKFATMWTSN